MALVPACAVVAGVWAGILLARPLPFAAFVLVALWAAAAAAGIARRDRAVVVCVTIGFAAAAMALGGDAAARALTPAIRTLLEREVGGFTLASIDAPPPHDPFTIRARLEEDAMPRGLFDRGSGTANVRDDGLSVRVSLESIRIRGVHHRVRGGARLSVAGATRAHAGAWRAGRVIEVPVTFRRPARYLNDGVPDFERDVALDGIALNASAKSAMLVEVVALGNAFEEAAADVRALVRARVGRWVGARDPLAGAIVTAILIGDRTGLPDEVRTRLQAAGTYHVIAISGGNIAILAALIAGVLLLTGLTGRLSTAAIIVGLVAYAAVVNAGPSVWRATATAVAYLAARLIDHRSPPWNAMAVSAALLACMAPLDVRNAGFALTFGATAAIVEAGRRVPRPRRPARVASILAWWIVASVAASVAAEIVLLPIFAAVFSRVTSAGLVLNLVAVPLMTIAQVAGLGVVAGDSIEPFAEAAGAIAAGAASMLVASARLIEVVPWLAIRVPAPSLVVVLIYYVSLGAALWVPRRSPAFDLRALAASVTALCAIVILIGAVPRVRSSPSERRLTLTVWDVGQAEAILLRTAAGWSLMIDTGGAGFDGNAFDIGGRVLAPALWARGIRSLDVLAITHGDPDHIGGAAALVRDLSPGALWQAVPVPGHEPQRALESLARARRTAVVRHFAGTTLRVDDVTVRVLHPPQADWERQRVRNDDSLVLEVRHGDVAILLTGDIGSDVERAILPHLSSAAVRILKVAHHGSRTSTSRELLDTWKPQIAVISCGRGNRFGHPARDVIARLEDANVRVYRTDRDGEVTLESDGVTVRVRTFVEGGATTGTKD